MIKELLNQIPLWYVFLGILWSAFQGIRGAIEQNRNLKDRIFKCTNCDKVVNGSWNKREKWIILYIHDFAFRFVCTFSGFIALYLAYFLIDDNAQIQILTSGTSVLIVFLSIIGIIGVGGQLHYIILMGKWPKST